MPVLEDPPLNRPAPILVEPSLAIELFGAVLVLRSGRKAPPHPFFDPDNPKAAELGRRARELWPGEIDCPSELLIVAESAGLLFEQDGDRLLAALPGALQRVIEEPALESETAPDRAVLLARLDALRRKPSVRRRWLALFADVWEEVRVIWETEGLAAVREACREVRSRLADGDTVWDLDDRVWCWRDDPATRGVAQRVGAVVPGYCLGQWKVFIDLPGVVLIALRLDGGDEVAQLRRRAAPLAERLKALSDGTRLAILAHVAARPARITDVARTFRISQPTASVHFRVLRDAGLVAAERRDGQTLYLADRRHIDTLLEEGRQLVAQT